MSSTAEHELFLALRTLIESIHQTRPPGYAQSWYLATTMDDLRRAQQVLWKYRELEQTDHERAAAH